MKHYILILLFAIGFTGIAAAQTVKYIHAVKYFSTDPVRKPKINEPHLAFNTTSSSFFQYDRTAARWRKIPMSPAYGEMSISNDTSTISFAATTPAPIQDLTAGPLSSFEMVSDSVLRYTGATAQTFLVNYSACISFAEATGIVNGYVEVGGAELTRTRFRQSTTLATEREMVSGTCIVQLSPGALVRFMFVPDSHFGTDILSIYQFNLNITQLN